MFLVGFNSGLRQDHSNIWIKFNFAKFPVPVEEKHSPTTILPSPCSTIRWSLLGDKQYWYTTHSALHTLRFICPDRLHLRDFWPTLKRTSHGFLSSCDSCINARCTELMTNSCHLNRSSQTSGGFLSQLKILPRIFICEGKLSVCVYKLQLVLI